MAATTQTRRIVISVDTKGNQDLKALASRLGEVQKNTKSLASNFQFLTNAFSGYIGALGIRELASMSDEMQNLSNRLKIVTKEGEDTKTVLKGILDVANETQQSVSEVGTVYVRLGSALKSTNASAESLLALTKALVNSFRISGSTGTETTATIIQLSQAFASGTLRGQELRSVLLQNAELAKLLRERFGTSLAEKAEKGLISVTEVLTILRDNMDRINASAKVLTPTFEQTLTKALNTVRFALFNLNEEFKLSAKFASALDIVIEKMSLLLAVIGVLALTQIPALIASVKALGTAVIAFSVANPLVAALVVTSAVVIGTSKSLDDFVDKIRNLGAWIIQLNIWVKELAFTLEKTLAKALFKVGLGTDEMINDLALQLDKINELTALATELGTPKYKGPMSTAPKDDGKKAIQDLIDSYEKIFKSAEKMKKPKEVLVELNAQFAQGVMTIKTYSEELVNFELYKVNKEFKEGKFDVLAYNQKLREIQENGLNRELAANRISLRDFNDQLGQMKLTELKEKLDAGRMSLVEYNIELTKISQKFEPGGALIAGTSSFLDSIGTVSSNVADGIKQTFSSLEDALFDFVKTGKFNFRQFAQAVLDDLTRIIIRASIIRPIAQGILGASLGDGGASAGGSYNDYSAVAAKGLAFDKGIRKFASGGIVDGPTTFGYGGGKRGLMGEAGPEAILPLSRGSGGKLGVSASVNPVTINIINQSGANVQQSESTGPSGEKSIDILITSKVKEGIMSGQLDSTMKSAYGLTRKGG